MASNAVARETLFALRETIARLEGKPVPALSAAEHDALAGDPPALRPADSKPGKMLTTGVSDVDAALQGGFPLDALTEIRSSALRDAGATAGFVLALTARLRAGDSDATPEISPILWIGETVVTMEAGLPYALGLRDFGVEPLGFLYAAPRKLDEALWLAETALASAVFTLVVLEVRGNPAHFGLTESRRLSLRAKAAGRPLFVLRQAGEEEASSALLRLCIEPAPAAARLLPDGSMLGGSIGNPSFRLTLEKSRNPAPLSFVLEWNAHDRQFFPVAQHPALVERPAAHSVAKLSAAVDRSDRPQTLGSVLAYQRAS
jgi:protein ImuA